MRGDTDLRFCTYTCTELPHDPLCCHFTTYYNFPEKKSVPELHDQPTYILQLGSTWIASCQRTWYSTEISCDLHLFFQTDTLNDALTIPLQSVAIHYTSCSWTGIKWHLQLIQCQPDPSCNEFHIWTSLYHHCSININRNIYKYRHWNQFLIIKPTRCTNFSNLFLEWNSACFRQFLCPSSGVFHCRHNNSYGFADSFQAESSWSCLKAVSKPVWHRHISVCTVKNSWWRTEELSETCRVSFQK